MVPILVLLTIATSILITWLLEQRRDRVRDAAVQSATDASGADLLFHPGNAWIRRTPDGLATIGASDFAAGFAGKLSHVRLPREGERLRQGEPAWSLRSERGRELTQLMPVNGKVLAVNKSLFRNPEKIQESPYGEGWLLRVRPGRHPGLGSLFGGVAANVWRDALRVRVANRTSPLLAASAYDGGEWSPAFGDRLDDECWETMREDLFPSAVAKRVS